MPAVGLPDLVELSQKLRHGRFQIRPWLSDTRGNAFSVNSRGHIHHPENLGRVAVNWACLTERLLYSSVVGVCVALEPRVTVSTFQYVPPKYLQ